MCDTPRVSKFENVVNGLGTTTGHSKAAVIIRESFTVNNYELGLPGITNNNRFSDKGKRKVDGNYQSKCLLWSLPKRRFNGNLRNTSYSH